MTLILPKPFIRALLKTTLLVSLAIVGPRAMAAATPGCPWIQWSSTTQGIVDSNAAYFSSIMPTNVAAGTTVQVYAGYPQARFFNFTLYHKGSLVDHIPDADLYPAEGGSPAASVAAIPYSNNYSDTYLISIVYQAAPADPMQRAPNTLYAGADSSQQDLLMMRVYLPNPGADITGDAGLPQLTQINPDGSSNRFDNVSGLRCTLISWGTGLLHLLPFPLPYIAPKMPAFSVVPLSSYNGGPASTAAYANFDSGYVDAVTSTWWAPIIVVRSPMPATPSFLNPLASPDARYFSFCEYGSWTRTIVGCLADQDITPQADGYFYIVLSQASDRPSNADTADGYNWMAALPPDSTSILTLRQILADPAFPGNYKAASVTGDPMATLGEWAPQVTYCDATTFDNNALSGGAALFAACGSAYASAEART